MKKIKIFSMMLALSALSFQTSAVIKIAPAKVVSTHETTISQQSQMNASPIASEVTNIVSENAKADNIKNLKAKGNEPLDKTLYIILAIFVLGWVAMGVNDNWEGTDWLICLLLNCLFILPGIIYALVKMKKYYK